MSFSSPLHVLHLKITSKFNRKDDVQLMLHSVYLNITVRVIKQEGRVIKNCGPFEMTTSRAPWGPGRVLTYHEFGSELVPDEKCVRRGKAKEKVSVSTQRTAIGEIRCGKP
jgi:hypothetical protein